DTKYKIWDLSIRVFELVGSLSIIRGRRGINYVQFESLAIEIHIFDDEPININLTLNLKIAYVEVQIAVEIKYILLFQGSLNIQFNSSSQGL
ncbi:hypothetical protein ACJX0J_034044, partial [Zea mays]